MLRLGYPTSDDDQSTPNTFAVSQSLHLDLPSDLHIDATAPPPSESGFPLDDYANSNNTLALPDHHHSGINIIRIAQDAIAQIGDTQAAHTTPNQLVFSSQYCNRFHRPVLNRLHPVIARLESGHLFIRIVVSQNDTIKSIKSQIADHRSIFDRKGYPDWSKDIMSPGTHFDNLPWCHLVFRGALESDAKSMRSEFTDVFTAYEKAQRALDIGAIQNLPNYIQVLKSLDGIHERVQKYGMCSTEYQITVRSGLYKNEHHAFITSPAGCRIADLSSDGFRSEAGTTSTELVVWPPPASGRLLPRSSQIVRLQVVKEIVASKFQDLQLRDVEDLGLEKLGNSDLKLLLSTPRFANGAAMLAHKFYLGNHISSGFMSNLARHWLLCTAERNELAFKHLLLIPDRTSMDLIRVMMAAVNLGTADQIRTLCLELSARKHVLDCCEAIASAPVAYGITARARLCLECLDPAVMNAVRNANRDKKHVRDAGVLKFLLGFAETNIWKLRINAFLHLLEIGATDYSAALHADQVDNDQTSKKLERLARYLKHSNMRKFIINASRRLQDLELYVQMLNSEQLPQATQYTTLLMRLINAAGYTRVAELSVPIESGLNQQVLSSWLMSGPSDGLCILGEIYLQNGLADRNPAPPRDHELLGRLTGQSVLDKRGRWVFFQGYREENVPQGGFWPFSEWTVSKTTPVWRTLLEKDCSAQSHAHLSEQLYFHTNGNELPNAQGLSLIKLQRDGVGDLVGRGLAITPRIAKDIWHLGGCLYYSMSRGRLWKLETEGTSCHAGQVDKLSGNFLEMSRGGILNLTIS